MYLISNTFNIFTLSIIFAVKFYINAVLGLSRETELARYMWRYMKRDLFQEFAHEVSEAGKSHRMLSANQRTRRVSGVIQSKSEGLRTELIYNPI